MIDPCRQDEARCPSGGFALKAGEIDILLNNHVLTSEIIHDSVLYYYPPFILKGQWMSNQGWEFKYGIYFFSFFCIVSAVKPEIRNQLPFHVQVLLLAD